MTVRRLAGIEFVAVPPPLPEALPRMDIGVFVGFAATGPLHIPVAVESVADYANVFGPDAPLAWDGDKGERLHAHLGPSVRTFFSNGGRRCWVIRVARSEALRRCRLTQGLDPAPAAFASVATYNRFPLDGMLAAWSDEAGLHLEPAAALARCEGSWSDDLLVQTALQETSIAVDTLEAGPGGAFTFATTADVVAGDVLKLMQEGGLLVFGRVGAVKESGGYRKVTLDRTATFSRRPGADLTSPPQSGSESAVGTLIWCAEGALAQTSPPAHYASAKILTFDVRVSREGETGEFARAHGLARRHPRAWMARPTDHELYTANERAARADRFPLAGAFEPPSADSSAVAKDIWLIPLAVGADLGEAQGPLAQAATALERDGLAGFDPGLFLDPAMEPWQPGVALPFGSVGVLAEEADFLRYESPRPRRLFGIHAALGFDAGISEEATLICVPDALHPGWEKAPRPTGGVEPVPPTTSRETREPFASCETATISAPQFAKDPNPGQLPTYSLKWSAVAGASGYVVQAARLPDYADACPVHDAPDRSLEVSGQGNGRYYYRVKAIVADAESGWSQGIAVDVHADAWTSRADDGFADDERGQALVDVQRALLRMSAAKGELFAVLSLPGHYRERDAIAHAARLNSGPGETSPATYGALYHPWPVDRRADASYFAFPPDGPVMGVLAARALERGAWIAPANEVMNDFVALRPLVATEAWLALLEAQVNILRLDARGFLLMSEDTLATGDDADLRPICVRRLLILLRRLALRRGANYVFEPHDDTLRRTVQRAFHQALSELFARGAFAGRTPEQSFQVVTDETINSPQSAEMGRFFVDLKVAPSLPLAFLTVRLRQLGERLTASEGR